MDETPTTTPESASAPAPSRLPSYILDAVALMALNAVPVADIVRATGLPERRVKGLLAGKNKTFDKILEGYRKKLLTQSTYHQVRLLDLLDSAYRAIGTALDSEDAKTAKDTAWELMDRVLPRREDRLTEGQAGVNLTLQANVVQAEVSQGLKNVLSEFGTIIDAVAHQDPNAHVKSGAEALPKAIELPVTVAGREGDLPDSESSSDFSPTDEAA